MTTSLRLPATCLQNCEFCFNMMRPNSRSTWCLWSAPRFFQRAATQAVGIQPVLAYPVPDADAQWSFCWFSSQGFQDLSGLKLHQSGRQPLLMYCHQQICRMYILYLCPQFCPHCWWRYWTIRPLVSIPGILSYYLLPPICQAIGYYPSHPAVQGFKTLCNKKEGAGKQNDMKC